MTDLRAAAQQALDCTVVPVANPTTFTIAVPPKAVGFWVLYPGAPTKTKFGMSLRPTNEQIRNTEALLGWGWEEA